MRLGGVGGGHFWEALHERLVLLRTHAIPIAGKSRIKRDSVPAREVLRLRTRDEPAFVFFCMERIVQLVEELIIWSYGDLARVSLLRPCLVS